MSDSDSYRERIYRSYITARDHPLAATTLSDFRSRLPYLRRMIRLCFPLNRDVQILELGCGHGALVYALRLAGYRNVRGVDQSVEQIAAARRLGIDGIENGDALSALCATGDQSLDVVVAFDLIEHFTKPEIVSLVDQVHRVLKPGGAWVIHAPNAEGSFGACMRYWDFTHELAFTRVSLAQLLKSSGFPRVTCFEDTPVPHGVKSMIRALGWQVIRFGLLLRIATETGSFDREAIFTQNLLAVAHRDN